MDFGQEFWIGLGQIIFIDLLLSGDNAVVIALACRNLPRKHVRTGIILGASAAILLRVIFTLFVTTLLATPYLKIIGGLLLLWIAVKLMTEDTDSETDVKAGTTVGQAIRTIVIADAAMSLDNVIAIAAIAKESVTLLVLGLIISMPLIIGGSAIVLKLLHKFPLLIVAGAALLGWLAGEMLVTDIAVKSFVAPYPWAHDVGAGVGAVLVVIIGYILRGLQVRRRRLADVAREVAEEAREI